MRRISFWIHGVNLVVRVLRLVLEPANLHEELLRSRQSREDCMRSWT